MKKKEKHVYIYIHDNRSINKVVRYYIDVRRLLTNPYDFSIGPSFKRDMSKFHNISFK